MLSIEEAKGREVKTQIFLFSYKMLAGQMHGQRNNSDGPLTSGRTNGVRNVGRLSEWEDSYSPEITFAWFI